MTTGPKKIISNIPGFGIQAPEHAPLEYPSESEEEIVYGPPREQ